MFSSVIWTPVPGEDPPLTTRVVTGSQQNTTSRLAHTNQVASSRSAQNTILTNQQLLDTIGRADLGNLRDHLAVIVATITTNNQESILGTLRNGQENAGDEGLGVVGLLEDLDLLAKTGTGELLARQLRANITVSTYVPGFWSVKGWMETVWTDMVIVGEWEEKKGKFTDLGQGGAGVMC